MFRDVQFSLFTCSLRDQNAVKNTQPCVKTGATFSKHANSNKDFHTCLEIKVPKLLPKCIGLQERLDTMYPEYLMNRASQCLLCSRELSV